MAPIPKLALIPSGYKAGKIYSVLPTSGVGDFDFTRPGSATRINSSGLIETVATGVPRLNYPLIDGVVNGCPSYLLEPQSINRIPDSEALSTWGQTNVTTVDNSAISPDGTLSASKITNNPTSGSHRLIELATTVNSSGEATYSVFLKKGTMTTCFVNLFSGSTISNADVDLVNGTIKGGVGTNHKIEKYPNDWFKVSITGTLASTSTFVYIYLKQLSGYVANNEFLYAWGGQLEENDYPTSYIPNYGSAAGATRSAETANGAGNSQIFNDSEGVLFAEISALDKNTTKKITLNNGSNSQVLVLEYTSTVNQIRVFLSNGSLQFNEYVTLSDVTNNNKISIKYKVNDFSLFINGFELAKDLIGTTFAEGTLTNLNFDDGAGNADFYGNTKQIQYYDSALTDSELETLTSWVSFQDMATSQLYTIE